MGSQMTAHELGVDEGARLAKRLEKCNQNKGSCQPMSNMQALFRPLDIPKMSTGLVEVQSP